MRSPVKLIEASGEISRLIVTRLGTATATIPLIELAKFLAAALTSTPVASPNIGFGGNG